MDIDYAIRKYELSTISATSTKVAIKLYENWERSNRLSVMFIKSHISVGIHGSIEKHDKVQDLLKKIDDQFAKFMKSLVGTLCFVLIRMPNSIPKRRNYGCLAL